MVPVTTTIRSQGPSWSWSLWQLPYDHGTVDGRDRMSCQLPYDHVTTVPVTTTIRSRDDGPCDNYHTITITTVPVTTTVRSWPWRSLWQLPYDHDHDGPCDNYHTITITTVPVTTTIRSRPRRSLWQLPYDHDRRRSLWQLPYDHGTVDGPCDNYHTTRTTTVPVTTTIVDHGTVDGPCDNYHTITGTVDGPCDNYHTITTRRSLWQLPYDHDHDGPCDNYVVITTTTVPVTTTVRSRSTVPVTTTVVITTTTVPVTTTVVVTIVRRSLWQLPYDHDHDGHCGQLPWITWDGPCDNYHTITGPRRSWSYHSCHRDRRGRDCTIVVTGTVVWQSHGSCHEGPSWQRDCMVVVTGTTSWSWQRMVVVTVTVVVNYRVVVVTGTAVVNWSYGSCHRDRRGPWSYDGSCHRDRRGRDRMVVVTVTVVVVITTMVVVTDHDRRGRSLWQLPYVVVVIVW